MEDLLIIDKENSSFLVRPTIEKWITEICYRVPRKSKKGYVGSKYHVLRKEYENNYEANALEQFENWKNEYYEKLKKQEIIYFTIECYPIIIYNVKCPKCGKDAEIISFLMMFCSDEGESMAISCKHCYDGEWDWIENKVGICYDTSFFINREELKFHREINVNQLKWEDWEKYKNV